MEQIQLPLSAAQVQFPLDPSQPLLVPELSELVIIPELIEVLPDLTPLSDPRAVKFLVKPVDPLPLLELVHSLLAPDLFQLLLLPRVGLLPQYLGDRVTRPGQAGEIEDESAYRYRE